MREAKVSRSSRGNHDPPFLRSGCIAVFGGSFQGVISRKLEVGWQILKTSDRLADPGLSGVNSASLIDFPTNMLATELSHPFTPLGMPWRLRRIQTEHVFYNKQNKENIIVYRQ